MSTQLYLVRSSIEGRASSWRDLVSPQARVMRPAIIVDRRLRRRGTGR